MTDCAAVNHATIEQVELSWRKKLNLVCHFHPLHILASSVQSTLRVNEPDGVDTKLFGSECILHWCILAFNKMQYKDGKVMGYQKDYFPGTMEIGFTSCLR